MNCELHPRFSELVSQHGLPIAASDAASVTLAASLAEVRLFAVCCWFSIFCHVYAFSSAFAGHTSVGREIISEKGRSSVQYRFVVLALTHSALMGGSFDVDP